MSETFIHPSRESIEAVKAIESDGPVVMLNLLRFKPGGADAYQEYVRAVFPFLRRAGADIVYRGRISVTIIGDEEWDQTILVRYPSCQAFLEMIADPDYPGKLRGSAVMDTRLFLTLPSESAVD